MRSSPWVLATAFLTLWACAGPTEAGPEENAEEEGEREEQSLCSPPYVHAVPEAGSSGPCEVSLAAGIGTPSPGPTGEAETTVLFTLGPYQWDVHQNLTYGVRGGRVLQGDLWVPRWTTTHAPGLVLGIHGGGWEDCTRRRDTPDVLQFLLKLSVASHSAFFNLEYRLAQEGGYFPENLKDVRCAAQHMVARLRNTPSWGVDAERMVVVGESAGAHLAAMLALTQDVDAFDPGCSDGTSPPPKLSLRAAYAFSPVTDLPALAASSSLAKNAPQRYTNNACDSASPTDVHACGCKSSNRCVDASPVHYACQLPASTELVLIHAPRLPEEGEYDFLIPYAQSQALAEAVSQGHPQQVEFWTPDAQSIRARDCYSEADIVRASGKKPDGSPMLFAHGFMPCLYEPVLPLLGLSVQAHVGGE